MALCAPLRDVLCRVSQFFNAVRQLLAEGRRVRRYVRASADRCILRDRHQQAHARSV